MDTNKGAILSEPLESDLAKTVEYDMDEQGQLSSFKDSNLHTYIMLS